MAAVPSSSVIQSQFWRRGPSKSCKSFAASNSLYNKHTKYTLGKTSGSLLHSETIQNRNRMKVIASSVGTSVSLIETGPPASYLLWTEYGGPVNVVVKKKYINYSVCIELSSLQISVDEKDKPLICCWSIISRSDSSDKSPTIETVFTEKSLGKLAVELEFEHSLAPFYLSFVVKLPTTGNSEALEIKSHRNTHFCVPVGFRSGHPAPLGFTALDDSSINFALFSSSAESVILCLYDDTSTTKPALEIDLDPYVNRTGCVWHVLIDDAFSFTKYGYRIRNGDEILTSGVLLDPYAKVIETIFPTSLPPIRLGKLSNELQFDWSGDVPVSLPMETLFVYRLNAMKFTIDKSSKLPEEIAGTFSGITEKLQHFKSLGVNAILLEPISLFDEQQGPYFPLHFFSPENASSINSMKQMVKKLHENGLEVLVEVVFSTEAGDLRELDKLTYSCGRHLNCNHPIVQQLILDSLRHWVTEFHVDGFCFINAASLLMGSNGEILTRPPLVEAIAFDPLLYNTKIIADYRDPLETATKENVNNVNVNFPHWKRWAEINDKFRDDVRRFLKGDGPVSDLATRICGSGDMFMNGRGPASSFNFIAGNSGLSLVDLVSFSSGIELASEKSWNCGEEGPTKSSIILQKRLKQIRNFLFIQFVSLGVPVLNSGDECGQSSGGSTKYTDRNPFNWNSLKTGFGIQTSEFISFLTCLRTRRKDVFQRRNFLKEEDIEWCGKDGKSSPKWEDPISRFLGVNVKVGKGNMFIAFNGGDRSESVVLPLIPAGMEWFRLVDTGLSFPGFFMEDGEMVIDDQLVDELVGYKMKSHSCALFEARPEKDVSLVNSL